jgi:hypothetical protein
MVVREGKAFLVDQVFARWELYCASSSALPDTWVMLAARVRDQLLDARDQCNGDLDDLVRLSGVRSISPRTVLMMRRAGLQPPVIMHCMCPDAASCSTSACVCRQNNRKCTAHCHPVSMTCGNCNATVKAYDTLGFPPPAAATVSHKKGTSSSPNVDAVCSWMTGHRSQVLPSVQRSKCRG